MSKLARASNPVLREVRRSLRAEADPAKAGPMQAYMKSSMPCLGVQTPKLRAATRSVYDRRELDFSEWRDTVLTLIRYVTSTATGFPPSASARLCASA